MSIDRAFIEAYFVPIRAIRLYQINQGIQVIYHICAFFSLYWYIKIKPFSLVVLNISVPGRDATMGRLINSNFEYDPYASEHCRLPSWLRHIWLRHVVYCVLSLVNYGKLIF